jgi:hypothetical protein
MNTQLQSFENRRERGLCTSCEVLYINGIKCHERGCPEAYKDETRECQWCGTDFTPESKQDVCCSPCCNAGYFNYDCDCSACYEFNNYALN